MSGPARAENPPRRAARRVYDASYQTFLEVHGRLRPLYRRIDKGAT